MKTCLAIALLAAFLLATTGHAHAQPRYSGGAPRLDYEVRPTGLTPVFPASHVCAPIASAWGSQERYDNSTRLQSRNGGLHGGFDISLNEGTPVVAMAAGKVIAKGEGGLLEGIYLWLQHAPGDTGLPYRAVVKYQHLSMMPRLNPGEAVRAGQVVASSGLTGTVGRAFGPSGYPHLHVSLFIAPVSEPPGLTVPPPDGKLSDPLLLFLPANGDPANVSALPDPALRVAIVERDGRIEPAGSKVVWPVPCVPR
jgi:murein DD-endopeptidase MepM/ murein hydrolase activator NlpD